MKKFDIVKLVNHKPYEDKNIFKNLHGIVMDLDTTFAKVLFFNPQILDDYALIKIKKEDIVLEKENLSPEIKKQILFNEKKFLSKTKTILQKAPFQENDIVELLEEKDTYTKFGLHKGSQGVIAENNIINNFVLVDFFSLETDDCIAVHIDDIKSINKIQKNKG